MGSPYGGTAPLSTREAEAFFVDFFAVVFFPEVFRAGMMVLPYQSENQM